MDEQEMWKLYADELKQYKPLSIDEERYLFSLNTPEAKEKLFLHSAGLVIHIAQNYQNCGVLFLDIVSEGMMGLKKAIDEYDLSIDSRLTTYAIRWIRIYITNFIVKFKTIISLPAHVATELNNIRRLMQEEKIDIDDVGNMFKNPISKDRIIRLLNAASPTISLDGSNKIRTNEEETGELKDLLSIPSNEQPNEIANIGQCLKNINKILKEHFTDKEQKIFQLRFGIGCKRKTNIEIAKQFKFTEQRCSWIIQNMKQKMKRYEFLIFE